MKKIAVLSVLALAFAASNALATVAGEWAGGVQAGAHIPSGDYSDVAKTGWLAGVFLDYGVNDMLSLGAHIDYNATKAKDEVIAPPINNVDFTLYNYGVHGNLYLTPAGGMARPYVMGTVGAYSVKEKVESDFGDAEDTATKFGFGGGIGALFRPVGSAIGFGVEGAVHDVTDAFEDLSTHEKKSAMYYTVTGKITFSFMDMSQAGGTHRGY